jgi:glycosyltransferase involved in cell wall biosynthesis
MAEDKISVVLCTYNPREDMLRKCLAAIAAQDLPRSKFQFIVVDNNSNPPLEKDKLEALAGMPVDLIAEPRPGLAFARVAGFREARHEIIVFVDDDNELFSDYLSNVMRIAQEEPDLGVFGGKCLGVLEVQPSRVKERFLPFLGIRDEGDEPLTGDGNEWARHEPIGAGIVVRGRIGALYNAFLESQASAGGLGRTGSELLAGEDSLISRLAHLAGFRCGYRPELKLLHNIDARRLTWSYLMRLMEGHGKSYVRLGRINGMHFDAVPQATIRKMMFKNLVWRARRNGVVEAISHVYWDRGFYTAVNEGHDPAQRTLQDVATEFQREPKKRQARRR